MSVAVRLVRQPKACLGLSRSIKICCGLPRSPNPIPQLEPEHGVYESQIDVIFDQETEKYKRRKTDQTGTQAMLALVCAIKPLHLFSSSSGLIQ